MIPSTRSNPSITETIKVFAYLRVSTKQQVREAGDYGSLDKQHDAIKHYLDLKKSVGWEKKETIVDKAELGDDATRPGVRSLLEAAARGEVDKVVVMSQDRLARGLKTLLPILEKLENLGVEIYDAGENRRITAIESDPAYLLTLMKGYSSGQEQQSIRRRVQLHTGIAASNGYWRGSRPSDGYIAKKVGRSRSLVRNKSRSAFIDSLFARLENGEYGGTILSDLKLQGIKTPSMIRRKGKLERECGRRFYTWDHLEKIIRNPIYKGCVKLSYKCFTEIKASGANIGIILDTLSNGDVIYRAKHERTVSDERWLAANANLSAGIRRPRKSKTSDKAANFLLQGIIKCGFCGRAMTNDAHGTGHYVCMSVIKPGRDLFKECTVRRIPAKVVEDAVRRMVYKIAQHDDFMEGLVQLQAKRRGSKSSDAERASKIGRERAVNEKFRQNYILALGHCRNSRAVQELVGKIDELSRLTEESDREMQLLLFDSGADFDRNAVSRHELESTISELCGGLIDGDRPKMKLLIKTLFHSVVISPLKADGLGKAFTVTLRVNYPRLSSNSVGVMTPLAMDLLVASRGGNYSICSPFKESRNVEMSVGSTCATADVAFPLTRLKAYEELLSKGLKACDIAAQMDRSKANISQVMSLKKIDPKLRRRIDAAPPSVQARFTLNRLLCIGKHCPAVQKDEVEHLLRKAA